MPPLGHRPPAQRRVPFRRRRPRPAAGLLVSPLLAIALAAGAARAGSSTADSTWDSSNALQRAMEGVPAGARVTRTNCQDIALPGNNDRYRCTVFYETPPAVPSAPATPGTPAAPSSPNP